LPSASIMSCSDSSHAHIPALHSFPTRRSSDLTSEPPERFPVRFYLIAMIFIVFDIEIIFFYPFTQVYGALGWFGLVAIGIFTVRSEEHTSELQSRENLVCRLLLEKKKTRKDES